MDEVDVSSYGAPGARVMPSVWALDDDIFLFGGFAINNAEYLFGCKFFFGLFTSTDVLADPNLEPFGDFWRFSQSSQTWYLEKGFDSVPFDVRFHSYTT